MCGPLALPIAAAGMAAAGSLMAGHTAQQQANYQADIAKQNANMSIEAARTSLDQAQSENTKFFKQVGQVKGEQIAAEAANGIDVSSGTALTIQQDTEAGAQDDAQNLYKNQYERTRGHIINATNFVEQARGLKAQGQAAMINGVFGAASSAMSAFGQMKGLQAKLNPTGGGGYGGPSMTTSSFNPGSGPGFG